MRTTKSLIGLGILSLTLIAVSVQRAVGSDHADTPQIAQSPGTDITDVFMFPSPTNPNNVVLVMTVNPLVTPGTKNNTFFDPNVLYQFKIDRTNDGLEDRVIQAKFTGTGANQVVQIAGPAVPNSIGTTNSFLTPHATSGTFNTPFSPAANIQVFAGVREDPFFFDLERFFEILPDRATPLNGIPVPDPNVPKQTTWRAPGQAVDFLSNGNYSLLAIVVELPKSMLQQ